MRTLTKDEQAAIDPQQALELLKEGNLRFQSNLKANRDLLEQVNYTANGQYPFATILSCIDSRTSAELIFDQGLGDVFSIRVAGNIINDDILGSMEFACSLAGSKLIVVMGHSACGAVKGACEGAKLGHLTGLLRKINPAIQQVKQNTDLSLDQLIQKTAEKNVELAIEEIRKRSSVLNEMVEESQLNIIGAMYSVQSGVVSYLN